MLYDPKWEKNTKADPHSLVSLIAWLEQQPSDGTYPYYDCYGGCLIGLYADGIGCAWRPCHHAFWERNELHKIAKPHPWTFGAALDRARAIAAAVMPKKRGNET